VGGTAKRGRAEERVNSTTRVKGAKRFLKRLDLSTTVVRGNKTVTKNLNRSKRGWFKGKRNQKKKGGGKTSTNTVFTLVIVYFSGKGRRY